MLSNATEIDRFVAAPGLAQVEYLDELGARCVSAFACMVRAHKRTDRGLITIRFDAGDGAPEILERIVARQPQDRST